uniref:Uncharacterized protein n=1 Tax=Saccharum officinarum TaxID=4547 RepID=A0A678T503_SACOF|nr:hypothetical protein SO13M23_000009 [Saccharum officinarum]
MIVCLIGDLSAAVVLHGMNGEIFCFLPSSSAIAGVGGVLDSVVIGVCMVLDDGFLCGGFGTDGYVMVVFLCIGDRLLWMLFCAIEAHGINGDASLGSYHMVPNAWRSSVPLRGSSSCGELGALVLVASDSLVSDDVMANDHLFQSGSSVVTKQVGINVLHKTATKKTMFLRAERRSASSSVLWPSVAR